MIDKKATKEQLVGRKAVVSIDLHNEGGCALTANKTVVTICDVVRKAGIRVRTEPCPCCGQYAYFFNVRRENLTLIEDTAAEI
jgi:hypothetical protein